MQSIFLTSPFLHGGQSFSSVSFTVKLQPSGLHSVTSWNVCSQVPTPHENSLTV